MTIPETTLVLGGPLCRRCVRAISRRVSDVPGVTSLRVEAATGVMRVGGSAEPGEVAAALPPGSITWCERGAGRPR